MEVQHRTQIARQTLASTGLEPNIGALLSYALMVPPITPIVMLMLEKDNRYIRFNAYQSLFLGIFTAGGIAALEMLAFAAGAVARPLEILLNALIFSGGGIAFILWIYLLAKSFYGKTVKLPIIGDEAARRAWK